MLVDEVRLGQGRRLAGGASSGGGTGGDRGGRLEHLPVDEALSEEVVWDEVRNVRCSFITVCC